jgi:hypothetical protein
VTASVTRGALTDLVARLTEPKDRETYAALISYFDSLPAGDELFQLARLLGLLSLLGQRVPDAVAELLIEMRDQTAVAAEYHTHVDARLASLPQEIAEGVDASAIAQAMAEAFRQQIASTGLENTATLLRNASREMSAVTGLISASLRPLTQDYKSMAATISAELQKLMAASDRLREHNAHLFQDHHSSAWLGHGALALVLFLAGGLCGIFIEKRQTTDVLSKMGTQIQQLLHKCIAQPKTPFTKGPNSMSINRVTLAGFTGKDARSSSTQNGKSMTKLSVATTKRYKDAQQHSNRRSRLHRRRVDLPRIRAHP